MANIVETQREMTGNFKHNLRDNLKEQTHRKQKVGEAASLWGKLRVRQHAGTRLCAAACYNYVNCKHSCLPGAGHQEAPWSEET